MGEESVDDTSDFTAAVFRDLAVEAKSIIRRDMLNSKDSKERTGTAFKVLEVAGIRSKDVKPVAPIYIPDARLESLIATGKEVLEALENEKRGEEA